MYGTNPIAFACPRIGPDGGLSDEPFVFDQASAALARGDMSIAARDGEAIPPGCAIDEAGEPTTDPAAGLRGAQLPYAGYKGTNIALMVELLAASITGDAFAFEALETDNADPALSSPAQPTQHGQMILAIDPARCGGSRKAFLERVETLLAYVAQEAASAEEAGRRMRLPSQRRFERRRQASDESFELNRELYLECCELAGVDPASKL